MEEPVPGSWGWGARCESEQKEEQGVRRREPESMQRGSKTRTSRGLTGHLQYWGLSPKKMGCL